ncbi:MAG: SgcJ/EcaC family oxidoreductase [Vicinamibacterales bacterium]
MTHASDDITAVAAIRQALEAAENAGDADAAIALLADDAVMMVPDFPVQEGREACAAFLREIMPALFAEFDRHATYSSAEISVAGDMAIDRGTFSIAVSPRVGGDATQVTGKYLWILGRTAAGPWRIARLIVARDEPASEPAANC